MDREDITKYYRKRIKKNTKAINQLMDKNFSTNQISFLL